MVTFLLYLPICSIPCVIQVLYKNLGVDMKDVTPTSLLKDRKREIEGNPDFSNKDVGASQSQLISEKPPPLVPPVNQVELPLEVTNPSNSGAHPHIMSQVCFPYFIWSFDDCSC
jgi:CCR4-NOT transcription complex subunit 1